MHLQSILQGNLADLPCSITTAPSQPRLKSRLPFIDYLQLQRIQLSLGSRTRQLELGKHVCQRARRLRRARRQQRHLVLLQRRLVPTRQGCLVTGAAQLPACARHSLSASLLTQENERERPAHQCELARNCHSGCSAPIRKAQSSLDNDRNDTCHIETRLSPVPWAFSANLALRNAARPLPRQCVQDTAGSETSEECLVSSEAFNKEPCGPQIYQKSRERGGLRT